MRSWAPGSQDRALGRPTERNQPGEESDSRNPHQPGWQQGGSDSFRAGRGDLTVELGECEDDCGSKQGSEQPGARGPVRKPWGCPHEGRRQSHGGRNCVYQTATGCETKLPRAASSVDPRRHHPRGHTLGQPSGKPGLPAQQGPGSPTCQALSHSSWGPSTWPPGSQGG